MFRGSFTALITPFKGGKVDEKAFEQLVEWQIAEGTHGLVPVGTTGESPTLSHDEHKRVVELCVKVARKRVPVIAGAGSNSTDEAIDFTRHAKKVGRRRRAAFDRLLQQADAGRPLPPLQGDQRRRRSADHHLQRAGAHHRRHLGGDHGALRASSRTWSASRMRPPTSRASSQQRLACGKDFDQLSGEDATALGFMAHGGHGCISVTSNVAPRLCSEFQNACLKGDFETALALQDRLMPLHDALFVETNPAPVKYAAWRLGIIDSPECRLPLAPDLGRHQEGGGRGARPRRPAAGEGRRVGATQRSAGDAAMAAKKDDGRKRIAENRKARFEYRIDDTFEAGIELIGTEVKSLRTGQVNIAESYASRRERRHLPHQRLHPRVQGGRPLLPARAAPAAPPAAAQERDRQARHRRRAAGHDDGAAGALLQSRAAAPSCGWRWRRARSCTTSARTPPSATGSARRRG